MIQSELPVLREVVLLGGGHAHVAVLKSFGMRPVPGVRLTVISKDSLTPYSGMLPGFIAGHYQLEETHLDLRALCQFAGAQLYQAEAVGLDLDHRRVLLADRPPASFDLLSINLGSTPSQQGVPGVRAHAIPVKPIARFLAGWQSLTRLREGTARGSKLRIAVVGGGAGGVELCLATRHRLLTELARAGKSDQLPEYHLVTDGETILPTHNRGVQARFARILRERGVRVHLKFRVKAVQAGRLLGDNQDALEADVIFWVTHASAPAWLGQAGLGTNEDGFVAVNAALQSVTHPFVFAAGDIAAVAGYPRPKSGVFAVRQGRPLADNLRRALQGLPLRPFRPQRAFLTLISTGDRYAVASRSVWSYEGAWVWRMKDWIDRRWMRRYQELPEMPKTAKPVEVPPVVAPLEVLREWQAAPLRCGGCGAKVGSTILTRVLRRLQPPPITRDDVVVGLSAPDDAAVFRVPAGHLSVQSVDFFRSFMPDPYCFGQVAANHCLGDLHAMGAEPQSALAVAVAPFAAERWVEEQLLQLLSGAVSVLNSENVALAGGHTAEGRELAFGLVVNGFADPTRLLRKGGLRAGDQLILTKPLGTGLLFAAAMRRRARARWLDGALASMLRSNREAAGCFQRNGTAGCTDITGFGLAGHLVEMLQASGQHAVLRLAQVPLLAGALEIIREGIFSSLQPQNLHQRHAIADVDAAARDERFPILFDPQTAGGLLAGVPAERAQACLAELRAAGYGEAAIIGEIQPPPAEDAPMIRILSH